MTFYVMSNTIKAIFSFCVKNMTIFNDDKFRKLMSRVVSSTFANFVDVPFQSSCRWQPASKPIWSHPDLSVTKTFTTCLCSWTHSGTTLKPYCVSTRFGVSLYIRSFELPELCKAVTLIVAESEAWDFIEVNCLNVPVWKDLIRGQPLKLSKILSPVFRFLGALMNNVLNCFDKGWTLKIGQFHMLHSP